jgi:hypothetical protein
MHGTMNINFSTEFTPAQTLAFTLQRPNPDPVTATSHHTTFKYPPDITFPLLESVQTGCGANPVPCSTATQGSFPSQSLPSGDKVTMRGPAVHATSAYTPVFIFLRDTFWVYISSSLRVLQQQVYPGQRASQMSDIRQL